MLKVTNIKVNDLKESVIACRNAMRLNVPEYTDEEFEKSLPRAIKLANSPSGGGDQTFLNGIKVSFDVIYPCYWTPEAQRYHWFDIVTSSSKMHRLLKMNINEACNKYVSRVSVEQLEKDIAQYNEIDSMDPRDFENGYAFELRDGSVITSMTKGDALYRAFMICVSDCPMGLELFMRVSTNYLQLKTIYNQRKHHKLKEDWVDGFCHDFIENLPYAKEFITGGEDDES